MKVRVLMVALPEGWTPKRVERERAALPGLIGAVAPAEAAGIKRTLDGLEAGYCEVEPALWQRYRQAYTLLRGRA